MSNLTEEILAGLPARVDKQKGAALIDQHFFPISPRTLERWPITWQRINGRSLVKTEVLLSEAQRRVDAAPAIRGGK